MKTLKHTPQWRIVQMGRYLVLFMHGRRAKLFSPIKWEYTSENDVAILQHDATCIVSGNYGKLYTSVARSMVQPVPAMFQGL